MDVTVTEKDWLAERFEAHRPHLRSVAYRMLGSLSEAEDAVQDAWLRASRADAAEVDNFGGWLTVIVSRVCLNMLRSRRQRREDHHGLHLPDPILEHVDGGTPVDEEMLLAESVGLALMIMLDTLSPAERLAFVLHDMFDLPFDRVASAIGRTPASARQLATRGRRRIWGSPTHLPDSDAGRQREVADAYFRAVRAGDIESLMGLLDPNVVLRGDFGIDDPVRSIEIRGAAAVAQRSRADPRAIMEPVLVNGGPGMVIVLDERPFAIVGLVIGGDRIVEINAIGGAERVARLVNAIGAARGSRPTPPR
jgi:RNA polymerase sigma-70 factor (ECF subfamily)